MSGIFQDAMAFNGDISNWDVSSLKNMFVMFWSAKSFNCDLSKWDVSHVTNMDKMFYDAKSFKRKLCGASWVDSEATKTLMFEGSYGSIAVTACEATATFSPQSGAELHSAINECAKPNKKREKKSKKKRKNK